MRNSAPTKEKAEKEELVSQETMRYSSEKSAVLTHTIVSDTPTPRHRKRRWIFLLYIVALNLTKKKKTKKDSPHM